MPTISQIRWLRRISETERRRAIQKAYNDANGIVPTPAGKRASNSILSFLELSRRLQKDGTDNDLVEIAGRAVDEFDSDADVGLTLDALPELIDQLESKMKDAAKQLDFEEAANLRDKIKQLSYKMLG